MTIRESLLCGFVYNQKPLNNKLGFVFQAIFYFLRWDYCNHQKSHHLREYFWNSFQASNKQIQLLNTLPTKLKYNDFLGCTKIEDANTQRLPIIKDHISHQKKLHFPQWMWKNREHFNFEYRSRVIRRSQPFPIWRVYPCYPTLYPMLPYCWWFRNPANNHLGWCNYKTCRK